MGRQGGDQCFQSPYRERFGLIYEPQQFLMFLWRQSEGTALGVQLIEALLEAGTLLAVDHTQQFRLTIRKVGSLAARLQVQEPPR